MKHYNPRIADALDGLMQAITTASKLNSYDMGDIHNALVAVIDEAGMLAATERLIAESREYVKLLGQHLDYAGIQSHEMGRHCRLTDDLARLEEHAEGLRHIIRRRRIITGDLVNGCATVQHLSLEELPQ